MPPPLVSADRLDALSHQAAALSAVLARRRADLALTRAETATVAVSLEHAKEVLDDLLRKEISIRARAAAEPEPRATRPDFLPDVGLVRSLAGQLDVTAASVTAARQRKAEIQQQIRALKEEEEKRGDREMDKEQGKQDIQVEKGGQGKEKGKREDEEEEEEEEEEEKKGKRRDGEEGKQERGGQDGAERDAGIGMKSESNEEGQLDDPNAAEHQAVQSAVERNVMRSLRESVSSDSSFRNDHAKIWRDVTMPNLALYRESPGTKEIEEGEGKGKGIDDDQRDERELQEGRRKDADEKVILGVVTERIFEGVTCFTPTTTNIHEKQTTPGRELRIESSSVVRAAGKEVERVLREFGVLWASGREKVGGMRVLAPKVALERVMHLIKGEKTKALSWNLDSRKEGLLDLRADRHATGTAEREGTEVGTTEEASRLTRRMREREAAPRPTVKISAVSHVLHHEHFNQIMAEGVPVRYHESDLQLAYSTNLHGMSLHTLFNRVKTTSPTLIAIRDTKDRVFGCYAAAPWKASATRYYGTGESFVFGSDAEENTKVYKWSRENSFFQFTSSTFLAIGGGAGSHFALWIDEDLLMGTTSACSTFASPPLTDTADEDTRSCSEFKIVSLEVWAFVPTIRH